MNRRRQALPLCLDSAIVAVVPIVDQLPLEMLHGMKILQIQQIAPDQPKEILNHSVVQTVAFSTHALPDALFTEHSPILFVLVLPALVGMRVSLPQSLNYQRFLRRRRLSSNAKACF